MFLSVAGEIVIHLVDFFDVSPHPKENSLKEIPLIVVMEYSLLVTCSRRARQ